MMHRFFAGVLQCDAGSTPGLLRALALVTLLLAAGAAQSATIWVTTNKDRVANDGQCSLREAVSAANMNTRYNGCRAGEGLPTVDVIRVPRGTYILTRGSYGEDDNAEGDLDITESVVIEGVGVLPGLGHLGHQPVATIRNGIGAPDVKGDGDRVIDIDPQGNDGVDVTLRKVAIEHGDLGCNSSAVCNFGASGIDQHGNGSLTLESVRVAKNHASCFDAQCSAVEGTRSIAAIGSADGGDLTLDHTRIVENHMICAAPGCVKSENNGNFSDGFLKSSVLDTEADDDVAAGAFVMAHSEFAHNSIQCTGERCDVDALIDIDALTVRIVDSEIRDNLTRCDGFDCDTDESIEVSSAGSQIESSLWRRVKVAKNEQICTGESCDTDEVIDSYSTTGPHTWEHVTLDSNLLRCDGFDCDTDEIMDGSMGSDVLTSFTDVSFVRNRQICTGASCDTDEVMDSGGGWDTTLKRVRFERNLQFCRGEFITDPEFRGRRHCDTDEVIDSVGADNVLTMIAVSFLYNEAVCYGTQCDTDEVIDSVSGGGDGETIIRGLVAVGNSRTCNGEYCVTRDLWDVSRNVPMTVDGAVIVDNTITGNGANYVPDRTCDFNTTTQQFDECSTGIPALLDVFRTFSSDNPATISNLVIARNRSGHSAVLNDGGTLTLNHAAIINNRTAATGGGVLSTSLGQPGDPPMSSATTTINDSRIIGNRVSGNGGGFTNSVDSVMTLDNTTVSGNVAGGTGGGGFNDGTLLRFDSTIKFNFPNQCVDDLGVGC